MRDVDAGERELTGETQALHSRITKLEQVSHNLPGHKNVDEELDRAWREWKSTFDAIKDSIILTDGEFKIIQANLASSQLFGRPLDQVIGKTCWQLVHGTNEAPEGCPLKRAKDTKKHEEMEFYLPQKGIWAADSVDPVLDEQGRLTGVVHIIRDITDRKKAEEELRVSEERYRKQFEEAIDTIVLADPKTGMIVDCNIAATKLVEREKSEIIGKHQSFLHPAGDIIDGVSKTFKSHVTGEASELLEDRVITKSGQIKDVAIRASKITIEGKEVMQGIFRDITERKKAEEEIAKLAKFPSENPYPVLRIHKNGTVLYANKASEGLLKARSSGMGQPAPAEWHRLVKKTLSSGQVIREETEHEGRVFAFRAVPIADSDYVNFYGADITERKLAEEALREEKNKAHQYLDIAGTTLLAIDANGKVSLVNKKGCETLEYDEKDIIGKDWLDNFIPKRMREDVRAVFKRIMNGEIKPLEYVEGYAVISKSGKEKFISWHNSLIRDEHGKIIGTLSSGEDITERKKAEEEIAKLAKFPSENPYPVLRIHKNGTVLYANKASEGLLKARSSGMGQPAPAEWHRLVKKTLSSGQVIREETEHEGRVFAFRAVPITESNYVNFYGVDITEHKLTDETLRELKHRYQTLFESVPVGIGLATREGRVLECNGAMLQMTGYSLAEFKQINLKDTYQEPQSREVLLRRLQEDGFVRDLEMQMKRKDGTAYWASLTVTPFTLGGHKVLLTVQKDMTEHKQAEEALRETSQYLENLFNYANAPIIVWDPQFKITRFNHAFEALTGRSAHDVIGKSIKILFPTDKVESSMEFIRETLEGKRWETIEINILHLDGAVRTVLWNSATLFDLDEKTPVATIAQGQDITERKQAEQKLLEYQTQLKSLASQLTLAEERERHHLATKLHDRISQSLVISKIKLDALRKSGRSRKLDKALEDICNSIGQTIQDTRTLTFDLSSPVLYELGFETAVSEWLTDRIQKRHGITIEFEDDGEPKPLDDDVRILLFRDVRELLTNVVKHACAHKVKVSIRKVGSEIHISVEDDGWGFDTKKAAATAVRKGGFGLFSIRERLGQLGGHLEIESEPGCGCKVTMTAPLKQKEMPQ